MTHTFERSQQLRAPLLGWAVVSLAAAALGPFGTYDALGFAGRLAYWSFVVAVCCAAEWAVQAYFPVSHLYSHILRRAGYVTAIATFVYALNAVLFEGLNDVAALIRAFGFVVVVAAAIEVLVWIIRSHHGRPQSSAPAVGDALTQRLPYDKRGTLIRLEAQDHYLNVVTDAGNGLVLMRISDAVASMPANAGIQTHRSHWISRDAIAGPQQQSGKSTVRLINGETVPVSRGRGLQVAAFIEKL